MVHVKVSFIISFEAGMEVCIHVFSRSTLLIISSFVISFIWNIIQVLTQYHELYIASGGQERLIIGETFPDLEKRLLECNAF